MEKLTQEQVDKMIESHGRWLNNEPGGKQADFSNKLLQGIVVFGKNLDGSSFDGSSFDDSRFVRSSFDGSSFVRSSFVCSSFVRSSFVRSSFDDSRFVRSSFDGSSFVRSSFVCSSFVRSSFVRSSFDDSRFVRSSFDGSSFDGSPIVVVGGIGSRSATTIYFVAINNIRCGCWNDYQGGTLEEFEARVKSVYADDSKHGKEYAAAIALFKTMAEQNK
jgi:hypothetical protein